MKANKFIIAALSLILCAALASAQQKKAPTQAEREQWKKEMREYKHTFLIKELGLSKEQQTKFFAVYDEMEDEVARVAIETRHLEQKIENSAKPSNAEYDKAIEALFDQKAKEGDIEKNYLAKFKSILTKKQLFQLKGAERKYAKDIMKHHRRLRPNQSKK